MKITIEKKIKLSTIAMYIAGTAAYFIGKDLDNKLGLEADKIDTNLNCMKDNKVSITKNQQDDIIIIKNDSTQKRIHNNCDSNSLIYK